MITRPEIGFTERPRDIRNLGQLILPTMKIFYFGLSIILVPNIRVPTQKTLICDTALSIRVSPRTIDIKAVPHLNSMMSKEPKRKTNRHAHSTRDQNTGPFSKRKIKEVFSAIDPKQGYLGPVVQKKAKRSS